MREDAKLWEGRTFSDTRLGRDRVLSGLEVKLSFVQKWQQQREESVNAMRQDASKTVTHEEERGAEKRRTLDLLTVHDLKDELASHGIGSVHVRQQSGTWHSVEEVRDADDNPIDEDDRAHEALRASYLNFQQIALSDTDYVDGDGAVIFDATGHPGDVSRAELEDELQRLHSGQ